MSRAFISDKETWEYCPKAGERCVHAAADRECTRRECEHFHSKPQTADTRGTASRGPATRTVTRAGSSTADKGVPGRKTDSAPSKKGSSRSKSTRRSSLKKPVKWGGRSGGSW